MNIKLAVIKGDGIGPEIVTGALKVLDKIGEVYSHTFSYDFVDAGGISIDKYGIPLTDEALKTCLDSDSVLLGAVGGPKWDTLPGNIRPERALLALRKELGLFANIRPAKLYSEFKNASPLKKEITDKGIDMVIVRELTGGIYFGERGRRDGGPNGQVAYDTEMYSVMEVERIAHVAFKMAMNRSKKVANVDKANVLESSRLWREVIHRVAKEYPEVTVVDVLVDNMAMQLVKNPRQFDVIIANNMFGDIISDEAAQIVGSIGLMPSSSLGESGRGMYEPIHGSAPDIAGKDIANPIATILSLAMMLRDSFGLIKEAEAIEKAVDIVLKKGHRTRDILDNDTEPVGCKKMAELIGNEIK